MTKNQFSRVLAHFKNSFTLIFSFGYSSILLLFFFIFSSVTLFLAFKHLIFESNIGSSYTQIQVVFCFFFFFCIEFFFLEQSIGMCGSKQKNCNTIHWINNWAPSNCVNRKLNYINLWSYAFVETVIYLICIWFASCSYKIDYYNQSIKESIKNCSQFEFFFSFRFGFFFAKFSFVTIDFFYLYSLQQKKNRMFEVLINVWSINCTFSYLIKWINYFIVFVFSLIGLFIYYI